MNNIKQNMRWLALVLLMMFAVTGTSVILGHAIFISYLKTDLEQFKQQIKKEQEIFQEKKLFRIEI